MCQCVSQCVCQCDVYMPTKQNDMSHSFLLEAGDCDVDKQIGQSERKKLGKVKSYANEE